MNIKILKKQAYEILDIIKLQHIKYNAKCNIKVYFELDELDNCNLIQNYFPLNFEPQYAIHKGTLIIDFIPSEFGLFKFKKINDSQWMIALNIEDEKLLPNNLIYSGTYDIITHIDVFINNNSSKDYKYISIYIPLN